MTTGLESLSGLDLSGVSGHISIVYDNTVQYLPIIFAIILGFLFLFYITERLINFANGRKSKQYREIISDMYVVGKVKQFATEDKIEIEKETKEYLLFCKQGKNYMNQLDEVIEDHLKNRVQEATDKKLNKETKEKK